MAKALETVTAIAICLFLVGVLLVPQINELTNSAPEEDVHNPTNKYTLFDCYNRTYDRFKEFSVLHGLDKAFSNTMYLDYDNNKIYLVTAKSDTSTEITVINANSTTMITAKKNTGEMYVYSDGNYYYAIANSYIFDRNSGSSTSGQQFGFVDYFTPNDKIISYHNAITFASGDTNYVVNQGLNIDGTVTLNSSAGIEIRDNVYSITNLGIDEPNLKSRTLFLCVENGDRKINQDFHLSALESKIDERLIPMIKILPLIVIVGILLLIVGIFFNRD